MHHTYSGRIQMILYNGTFDVIVPSDCSYYPFKGRERRITYRTSSIHSDDGVYVVSEAKVYRYHHMLHFARFIVVDKVAFLDSLESVLVSYDDDTVMETMGNQLIHSELMSLMPNGCDCMKAMKHMETSVAHLDLEIGDPPVGAVAVGVALHDPVNMFDLLFSCPPSKHTKLIIVAKPDGSGGHMMVDSFGPLEFIQR